MLLDWPEQKSQLSAKLQEIMRSLIYRGLVAEVRGLVLNEGNRAIVVYPDGTIQEFSLKAVEATVDFDRQELAAGRPELFATAVRELAGGIGDQVEKDLIRSMEQSPARIGGMFGGEDDEATFQSLMQNLREMEMSFDEDGRPSFFFVAHPENASKLQLLNTPEREEVFNELIKGKRNEWLLRESHRRLVD